MAGRGTDIKLGGNKDFIYDGKKEDAKEVKKNEEKVKDLGGLFIIGTERHESRRIDNQLRGRSGRQGDPGSTIFFISLQDELMRIFGGDSIDGMLQKLGLKENESIDHPWINKAMERAQKKVESRNFDIRKTLIKFDDVMNDQRQVIFSQRLKILKENSINEILKDFFDEILLNLNVVRENFQKSGDEKSFLTEIKNITGNAISDAELIKFGKLKESEFNKNFQNLYSEKKNTRVQILSEVQNNSLEKKIFLQIIDFSWRSHLQYLEQLRQVIGLRQYGQKDPLSEFKKEAFVLFESLLLKIKNDLIKFLFNLNIVVSNKEQDQEKQENTLGKKSEKKVGRNEKCPCGSGKKFKHCHGSI
tara:strand:- start:991 stop:2070 length:1080 start_codon:yes stop_codon:yes gene_type:complete